MPRVIIKPDANDNFYVEWSTVVDAPTAWGAREDMERELQEDIGQSRTSERLARCDEFGTSALYGSPREFGFEDDTFIYQQQGILRRHNLKAVCERLDEDQHAEMSDLLEPFEDDDD